MGTHTLHFGVVKGRQEVEDFKLESVPGAALRSLTSTLETHAKNAKLSFTTVRELAKWANQHMGPHAAALITSKLQPHADQGCLITVVMD